MKEYFKTGLDSYLGSKAAGGTLKTLMNEIPAHQERVLGFLGNCAVTRYLRPASIAMYGFEIDPVVAAVWSNAVAQYCGNFTIINGSFMKLVEGLNHDRKGVFFFLDPPYVWSTRTDKRYDYDMNDSDHVDLIEWCKGVKYAKVMLCGYPNELYDSCLAHWRQVEYEAMTRGGYTKTEKVWMNYASPKVLQDSRFLGADFREREKLKRRRETIYRKIERMEEVERLALFDRLRERFPLLFGQDSESRQNKFQNILTGHH